MAKDKITDYSQTPSGNTDMGGISLLGTASPRVIKDYLPELMSQLADMNAGAAPLDDTFTIQDPDDNSKMARLDAANVPASTIRAIDAEAAYQLALKKTEILAMSVRGGAPKITPYTASGTHTFAAGTTYYQIVAVGAGGGSGAVDGQGAGTGGSSAGGNSGFLGRTAILPKGVLTTGTVVIGAGGTAGTSTAPVTAGGDGGDTTWADATVGTLTFKGGKGSTEITASGGHLFGLPLANGASSVSLSGGYDLGGSGITNSTSDAGGLGGSSEWGAGGVSTLAFSAAVAGVSGSGYGSGASGAAAVGVIANAGGAAGTGGRLEVWEW